MKPDIYKFYDHEFTQREGEPQGYVYPEPLRTIAFSDPKGTVHGQGNSPDRTVTSVFSTRPINATDFLYTFNISPAIGVIVQNEIKVPIGYIAVIRGLSVAANNIDALTITLGVFGATPITITIYKNRIPVPFLEGDNATSRGMNLFPNGNIDTHIIVNQGDTFGAGIFYPDLAITGSPIFNCSLYGNYILSDGLPANFEIGTKRIGS